MMETPVQRRNCSGGSELAVYCMKPESQSGSAREDEDEDILGLNNESSYDIDSYLMPALGADSEITSGDYLRVLGVVTGA